MNCLLRPGMLITACLMLMTNILHAEKTCIEKLHQHSKWLIAGAVGSAFIPIPGINLEVMLFAIFFKKITDYNAKRLHAAQVIVNQGSPMEIYEAHRIMDKFYARLIKKYPETNLSRDEVIQWLHKLNSGEVSKNLCSKLMGNRLENEVFPEEKINEVTAVIEEEKNKRARELQAVHNRNEKNQAQAKFSELHENNPYVTLFDDG